jgi:hypothetical protein
MVFNGKPASKIDDLEVHTFDPEGKMKKEVFGSSHGPNWNLSLTCHQNSFFGNHRLHAHFFL